MYAITYYIRLTRYQNLPDNYTNEHIRFNISVIDQHWYLPTGDSQLYYFLVLLHCNFSCRSFANTKNKSCTLQPWVILLGEVDGKVYSTEERPAFIPESSSESNLYSMKWPCCSMMIIIINGLFILRGFGENLALNLFLYFQKDFFFAIFNNPQMTLCHNNLYR